jgi:hypothetical protein
VKTNFASTLCLLLLGSAASGQSQGSQIGHEVAIPVHLQDSEEFNVPLAQLIEYGRQLPITQPPEEGQ